MIQEIFFFLIIVFTWY